VDAVQASRDHEAPTAAVTPAPAAADVFISYARENRHAAQRLADALAENRLDVWWDRDLVPGSEFSAVIEAQLLGAAVVVGLWSHDSVRSAFVRDECARALRADKLVPARIEDVELPLGFGQLHTLDLLDWNGDADDAAFQSLLLEIERRRGQRLADAARTTSSTVMTTLLASLRGGPGRGSRTTRRALLGAAAIAALGGAGYYAKHTLDRREADQHFRAGLDFQYAAVPRLENALNEYLSALERLPGHGRARYYLGHVYAQTGRNADALASFQLALSAGEAVLDRGQRRDAERQLVALAPEAGEAPPVTRPIAAVSSDAARPQRPPVSPPAAVAARPSGTAPPPPAPAPKAEPKAPPRTEPSTPVKNRLARSVVAMFDDNKDRRIVATTSLVLDPDDLSDAVPLAVERALAALRAPPLAPRESSGVVNTLVLLQSALPGTLVGNRPAIEELLAATDGAGDYTRLQAAKVRDRLQQAAKRKPVGYLQIASDAQRPLAQKIAEWLGDFGYAAPAIEVVGTRAPAQTELRVQGKSDRSYARWLAKVVNVVTTTPPTVRVLRNANPQVDTYEIWLGRDLCAPGGTAAPGCES